MGRVLFYHLTHSSLEDTLAAILAKSLAAGFHVDVRGTDLAKLDHLDQRLWMGSEEGFLPHGVAGGPHDALQPILLTTNSNARADTTCLMSIHGAAVDPSEPDRMDRVCILFDGHDPAAMDTARGQWRSLTGAGAVAEYWSQETGQWQKKMSTAG